MAVAADRMVRMGEWHVEADPDGRVACIGLGSCIGLALLDRRTSVAGVAHVMLPTAGDREVDRPYKYADLAVPALVEAVLAAGGGRHRLEAVLAGGAEMFARSGQEIGARNADAVTRALAAQRIRVRVQRTGGSKGRTLTVLVGPGEVTCREAGGRDELLLGGHAA